MPPMKRDTKLSAVAGTISAHTVVTLMVLKQQLSSRSSTATTVQGSCTSDEKMAPMSRLRRLQPRTLILIRAFSMGTLRTRTSMIGVVAMRAITLRMRRGETKYTATSTRMVVAVETTDIDGSKDCGIVAVQLRIIMWGRMGVEACFLNRNAVVPQANIVATKGEEWAARASRGSSHGSSTRSLPWARRQNLVRISNNSSNDPKNNSWTRAKSSRVKKLLESLKISGKADVFKAKSLRITCKGREIF